VLERATQDQCWETSSETSWLQHWELLGELGTPDSTRAGAGISAGHSDSARRDTGTGWERNWEWRSEPALGEAGTSLGDTKHWEEIHWVLHWATHWVHHWEASGHHWDRHWVQC
jgi:hypothetical protein